MTYFLYRIRHIQYFSWRGQIVARARSFIFEKQPISTTSVNVADLWKPISHPAHGCFEVKVFLELIFNIETESCKSKIDMNTVTNIQID